MTTGDNWARLGQLLIARRVELGFTRRAAWVRHLGLSHDRTILDLENAKRTNFDPSTLAFIELAYQWRPGSIRAVLDGGDPAPAQTPGSLPSLQQSATGTVTPPAEDADSLRFQRPPGLTDEQWDRVRRENADYFDYLINKAAQER